MKGVSLMHVRQINFIAVYCCPVSAAEFDVFQIAADKLIDGRSFIATTFTNILFRSHFSRSSGQGTFSFELIQRDLYLHFDRRSRCHRG